MGFHSAAALVAFGKGVGDDACRLSLPSSSLGGGHGHADEHYDRHQRTDDDPANIGEHYLSFPFWKLSQSRKLLHSEQLKPSSTVDNFYYSTNKQ